MGAARSSNVARAVSNVSNFVSNSTTANTSQANRLRETISFRDCTVSLSGDFNVNASSKLMQTNNQIVKALQDTALQNNIQQQMSQEATSKVGFFGIGYASASNNSNQIINATSQIINDMNTSANQYSDANQSFECNRSTINAKNLNIDFNSNASFLSSQTLNNPQTAKVVNNVSQSLQQKASATVEGMGLGLIFWILLFALIIYALGKPLDTAAGKLTVSFIVLFAFVGLLVWMYVRNIPPLFAEPIQCINHSAVGMGDADCVDMTANKIYLSSPPKRYIYSILPTQTSPSGGNLLQMAIARASGQSPSDQGANGGYRADTANNLTTLLARYEPFAYSLGIPNVPNPLTVPTRSDGSYYAIPIQYIPGLGDTGDGSRCTPGIASVGDNISTNTDINKCLSTGLNPRVLSSTKVPSAAIANLNIQEWNTYLNQATDDTRALFARFVLCDIIGGFDLNIWAMPGELIKFTDENNTETINSSTDANGNINYPNDTYHYHPDGTADWKNGLSGTGYIEGQVGQLDTRMYRFGQFMKKIGISIIVALVFFAIGIMIYNHATHKPEQSVPEQTVSNLAK